MTRSAISAHRLVGHDVEAGHLLVNRPRGHMHLPSIWYLRLGIMLIDAYMVARCYHKHVTMCCRQLKALILVWSFVLREQPLQPNEPDCLDHRMEHECWQRLNHMRPHLWLAGTVSVAMHMQICLPELLMLQQCWQSQTSLFFIKHATSS